MAIPSTGFTFPPANNTDFITEIYIGYYNRAPDPAGMNFWLNALAGGETLTQVANQFANSSESTAIYPFLTLPNLVNAGSFVTQVYNNILNRAPDAPGLAFWTAELQSGAVTPGSFILTLEASVNMQTGTADALTLAAKGTVAEDYVLRVATSGTPFSQSSAHASMAPVSGIGNSPVTAAEVTTAEAITTAYINHGISATFTLTTGIDAPGTGAFATSSITGNNNQIFGTFGTGSTATDTYQPGDQVIGLAGSTGNQLTLVDQGSNLAIQSAPSSIAATVSNISIVNVISGRGVLFNAVTSPAGFSGLTQLNVTAVGAGTAAGSSVTAAATTNIALTDANLGASTDSVNGGNNVVVTEGGVTGAATINVGQAGAGAAGTVAVTETVAATGVGAFTAAAISVKGGTTINVTANLAETAGAGNTVTSGTITVTGGATTTAVTVNQTAAATAAAAVTGVAGALLVNAVAGAPGVTAVTGVAAVAAATAKAAVAGVVDGNVTITDANWNTANANTITTVTLASSGAANVNDNALTTLNLSGASTFVNITNATAGGGTPTANSTLTVNLSGYVTTPGNIIQDVNGEIKTMNVVTSTADSATGIGDAGLKALNISGTNVLKLSSFPLPGSLTSIAVSGGAGFNDGGAGLGTGFSALGAAATLTTTSSGTITATLNDTTQTFVGSTGQDVITISDLADATKVVTGGTGTTNELILDGGAYALTAATAAKVTGFQTLGVTAAVTGSIDMSILAPTVSKLDIIGNSTIAFTKVATGAAISLDASSTSVSVKYVDVTGTTDSTTATIGAATNAAAITVSSLTLSDANLVGIGTLNAVSNDVTFGQSNVISTLVDNGLANLNVSGSAGLQINTLNEATTQATTFTINNTETGAAGVTIVNFTDANLGALTFTGSNASTITNLSDAGQVLSISNTGTSTANIFTLTDNSLTTLTLGSGVSLGQTAPANNAFGLQDGATTGVTVSGASDNAHVTINLYNGSSASNIIDSITLGNGNDFVTDASAAGTVNLAVGTGANLIVLGTAFNDTTAVYNVTEGAHTNTATLFNSISIGTAGTAYATTPNLNITGAAAKDTITLAGDTTAAGTGAANAVVTVTPGGTLAQTINALETAVTGAGNAHHVFTSTFGGDTYLVDSFSGTLGATDTTLVHLVGLHTFSATAGVVTLLT